MCEGPRIGELMARPDPFAWCLRPVLPVADQVEADRRSDDIGLVHEMEMVEVAGLDKIFQRQTREIKIIVLCPGHCFPQLAVTCAKGTILTQVVFISKHGHYLFRRFSAELAFLTGGGSRHLPPSLLGYAASHDVASGHQVRLGESTASRSLPDATASCSLRRNAISTAAGMVSRNPIGVGAVGRPRWKTNPAKLLERAFAGVEITAAIDLAGGSIVVGEGDAVAQRRERGVLELDNS